LRYCVHLQERKSKPSQLAWSVSLFSVTPKKTDNLWLEPYDVTCLYKCFTGDSFPRRKSGRSVKATTHLCLVQECAELYTVFIVQAYQTSQYVVPCGGIFPGKWRSSFAGSSGGIMNVQSACALNTRYILSLFESYIMALSGSRTAYSYDLLGWSVKKLSGSDVEVSGCILIEIPFWNFSGGRQRKTTKYLNQDSRCPHQDSNEIRVPAEYKSEASPLELV
jgi:hypothetical protein